MDVDVIWEAQAKFWLPAFLLLQNSGGGVYLDELSGLALSSHLLRGS